MEQSEVATLLTVEFDWVRVNKDKRRQERLNPNLTSHVY